MSIYMLDVWLLEVKTKVFGFDYQKMNMFEFVWCSKNNVRVCSMSDLVNLVNALLGSMFEVLSFKLKNKVFKFDDKSMNTFDVRVQAMLYKIIKIVIDSSLWFQNGKKLWFGSLSFPKIVMIWIVGIAILDQFASQMIVIVL